MKTLYIKFCANGTYILSTLAYGEDAFINSSMYITKDGLLSVSSPQYFESPDKALLAALKFGYEVHARLPELMIKTCSTVGDLREALEAYSDSIPLSKECKVVMEEGSLIIV